MEPAHVDIEKFRPHVEAITHAIKGLKKPKRILQEGQVSGQTDGSGNLVLELYSVPPGEIFCLHRVVLEASGYTPATKFSTGYAAIIDVMALPAAGAGYPIGSLRDFAPQTGLTQVFPQVLQSGKLAGSVFRENASAVVYVASGPTSVQVSVYYKGYRYLADEGVS
jgi:hypothetical protein